MKNLITVFCLTAVMLWPVSCKRSTPKKTEEPESRGYLESVVIDAPNAANTVKLKKDLQTLRDAVVIFSTTKGRNPESMEELGNEGVLNKVPKECFGGTWMYDAITGEIKSSTHPDL